MTTSANWRLVTEDVLAELRFAGLKTTSAYLVGSQVRSNKPQSDFDSIFIIDASSSTLSVESATLLRQHIDGAVVCSGIEDWYHYKLLTHDALVNMAAVDSFRLISLQRQNLHYAGPDVLLRWEPQLCERSFVTSLLVQFTYQFFSHLPNNALARMLPALDRWVTENLRLFPITKYVWPGFAQNYFETRNRLFALLAGNLDRKLTKASISTLTVYIEDYCRLFLHEAINKRLRYRAMLLGCASEATE